MKALKILIIALVGIVVSSILVLYFIWLTYPSVGLNILVLDKTVLDLKYSQHRSFTWVLNNARILKRDGSNYSVSEDYYGFQPIKPISEKQYNIRRIELEAIDSLSNASDAVYFADTYGVYFNEWFRGFKRGGESSIIEGGINQNDYLFLKAMKEKNKLVIGEYNILWGATSELNRFKTQELFGIQTTGWCGKYFSSLDTTGNIELSELAKLYKSDSNTDWLFEGSGILLVNNGRVIVLENEKHLNVDKPVISVIDSFSKLLQLPNEIVFSNWFEINSLSDSITTIANFQLNLTREGQDVFEQLGLQPYFPAISAYLKNGKNLYYFSGDFSNNKVITFYSRLANSRKMLKMFTLDDKKLFFQDFYFPLMENLLIQYAQKTHK